MSRLAGDSRHRRNCVASNSLCDCGQVHPFFTFHSPFPHFISHSLSAPPPTPPHTHTHTRTHTLSSQISNKKLTDQRPEEYKRAAGRASGPRVCLLIHNKNQQKTSAQRRCSTPAAGRLLPDQNRRWQTLKGYFALN